MKENEINAPQHYGRTFVLPIEQLLIPIDTRVDESELSGLFELAESMRRGAGVGQLHPVVVVWRQKSWVLAAGFRRALAMQTFREELGFTSILARRVREEHAGVLRLVELSARKSPLSYETTRLVHDLVQGEGGRPRLVPADIAAAIGRSSIHVRALARFYGALAPEMRAAWQNEHDRNLARRLLADLSKRSRLGD